jgi:large subunit ribosomal protein L17
MLRDKEAVEILFEDVAHRFVDRPGGYTRVLRLAEPRLGDAGTQAILEFVGVHDRVSHVSQKPAFVDDSEVEDAPTAESEAPTVDQAEAVAESGEAESTTSEEE